MAGGSKPIANSLKLAALFTAQATNLHQSETKQNNFFCNGDGVNRCFLL